MLLVKSRFCAANRAVGQSTRTSSLLHSSTPVERDSLSSEADVEAIQDAISDFPIAPVDESLDMSRANGVVGSLDKVSVDDRAAS